MIGATTRVSGDTRHHLIALLSDGRFHSGETLASMLDVSRNAIWKQMLRDYEQPALDPAIDDALVEYVEKRKQAIAAAAS